MGNDVAAKAVTDHTHIGGERSSIIMEVARTSGKPEQRCLLDRDEQPHRTARASLIRDDIQMLRCQFEELATRILEVQ